MIEIHDDWAYLDLWYVQGPNADYTVLVFRDPNWVGDVREIPCKAIARFRFFKTEAERINGLITGIEGWFDVPAPSGATPRYVVPLVKTLVATVAGHAELQPVTVHEHHINSNGAVFREVLAGASWAIGAVLP